ncbi:hypothetical protein [Bacillus sp. FJAT-50079]|uniref:hypothetical protein n=1 Tax=Bacillus sp. FJAT-50079 TaxID=2833577 RepID=UPI001BC922D8|nr:hypothetical protein [Bacillus sp. FJAT-50079]MBS4207308.1 hypothetical protein [Bacillus sp. FJAT-50079]
MIGFIRYQLISYVRSLKMIPPLTVFSVWIFILYAYSGVPILSSYAVSSMTIYLVMTWLAMSIFSLEEVSEKHLLFVQLNSKIRYIWGNWTMCFIFAFILILFVILYPIWMNNFKGTILPIHIGLTIYSHFFLAWFGMLVGTFFSITSFSTRKYAWLLAMFVIVVSISYEGLVEKVSLLKWVLLLFPPVTHVLHYLNEGDAVQIGKAFWMLATWAFAYSVLGTFVVLRMFLRKER